jgi:transformation/transcription domain-associated protein
MRDELSAGLNMLNTTNLDYFGPQHQSEIFRLKGVFLQARARLLSGGLRLGG